MRIVGITGFKGSGKDVLAAPLVRRGFLLLKFAGPLKNMIRSLLRDQGVDDEMIERIVEGNLKETPIREFSGCTSRWAQQSLGTEWGRVCLGESFWADVG